MADTSGDGGRRRKPASRRATNGGPNGTVPIRFGKKGNPVPMRRRLVQRARKENRRLYEDGSLGRSGSRRPPTPPRRTRRA
jgi:hypothetical protein